MFKSICKSICTPYKSRNTSQCYIPPFRKYVIRTYFQYAIDKIFFTTILQSKIILTSLWTSLCMDLKKHFATHVIEQIAVLNDSQLMNFYFSSFNLSMMYKIFMKNISPGQKSHYILKLVIGIYNYERKIIMQHVFSPDLYI